MNVNTDKNSAWKRAEDTGFDMSLVESNLQLSVAERLRRHDVALNRILKMRRAVQKRNIKG